MFSKCLGHKTTNRFVHGFLWHDAMKRLLCWLVERFAKPVCDFHKSELNILANVVATGHTQVAWRKFFYFTWAQGWNWYNRDLLKSFPFIGVNSSVFNWAKPVDKKRACFNFYSIRHVKVRRLQPASDWSPKNVAWLSNHVMQLHAGCSIFCSEYSGFLEH